MVRIIDIIDVGIVCWMVYGVWRLLKGTGAVEVVYGMVYIGCIYIVARYLELSVLVYVLEHTYLYLGFGVLILFQSELRTALARMGALGKRRGVKMEVVEGLVLAAVTLSVRKVGGLVVLERGVGLQEHILRGVEVDGRVSYEMIVTLFEPQTPLHDGAVIVRKQRIAAAGCFLPLSMKVRVGRELGTRHRAALGISEETDAIAIVVSEETGVISVAEGGKLERHLDSEGLRAYIEKAYR